MAKKKIDYGSLFTRRKNGLYVATYTDDWGKRHYLSSMDPEKLWHKLNDPQDDPGSCAPFSKIAADWQRQHATEISYQGAKVYDPPVRRTIEYFGDRDIHSITAAEISAYLVSVAQRGYARRTVQVYRDALRMIYNYAILSGITATNPVLAVPLPKNLPSNHRSLPSDEALAAVKRSGSVPFGLFALVCLYAGLRRGEALALTYEDIDRRNKVIHITKSVAFISCTPYIKEPKTEAGYRNAILLDVLADQIPEGSGLMFPGKDGGLMRSSEYMCRWDQYCTDIGHRLTAHQLRHGFATILYEAGIADKDAQELLGHSNIAITRNVYTHIRQSRRTETAARLNDFLNTQTDI